MPMTPKHLIRIASLSKAITATAVGLLWEQGKLDLDAPVQKYLPAFLPPAPLPSPPQPSGTVLPSCSHYDPSTPRLPATLPIIHRLIL